MPKPLMSCPPPPLFERRPTPTTVTMRAITEDDGEGEDPAPPLPSEPFDVVFDRAVDAYLSKDYQAALALFQDALRLDPGHQVCLHNVRRIEQRLADADQG